MKLSEAIRLGSMLHPQAFGCEWVADVNGIVLSTCAMGAAIQAGYSVDAFGAQIVDCPLCMWSSGIGPLVSVVAHLNDRHKLTRESIADWVETLEQAHATPETLAAVDPGVQRITESLRA